MAVNKLQMLRILEILRETDETHPLTMARIRSRLRLKGIEAGPKSVYRDLDLLRDEYPVFTRPGRAGGYYLGAHTLEDYEVKMLCDMVAAAPFLTAADSYRLVQKLRALGSPGASRFARDTLSMEGCKTRNVQSKICLDCAMRALQAGRKLRFCYGTAVRTVSPYFLLYAVRDYYLLCVEDGRATPGVFRIDRMTRPALLDAYSPAPSGVFGGRFSPAAYLREHVQMYDGPLFALTLRCTPGARGTLQRQFGNGVAMRAVEGGFLAHVHARESDGLYRWLMGHCDELTLEDPPALRENLRERLLEAAKRLGENG